MAWLVKCKIGGLKKEAFPQKGIVLAMRSRRKVGKSWGASIIWRAQSAPLVEMGLTDLPKSGGAMAPSAPPGDDTPAMQRKIEEVKRRNYFLSSLLCSSHKIHMVSPIFQGLHKIWKEHSLIPYDQVDRE